MVIQILDRRVASARAAGDRKASSRSGQVARCIADADAIEARCRTAHASRGRAIVKIVDQLRPMVADVAAAELLDRLAREAWALVT